MKELFRERDYTRVGYFQSVLESAGIKTFVRNQDLVTMTTEVPIPDMFPVLCVMDEEDYPRALTILSELESSEEKAAPEEAVKGVFVVGIALIFGGFAAGKFVQMTGQLIYEDYVSYWSLAMRAALAFAAMWIVWITVEGWRSSKQTLK